MCSKREISISQEINLFYADAGVSCSKLAKQIAKAGFARSAFLAGIPGTIGGALAMNAGCYGSETWDYVSKVLVIDAEGNQIIRFKEEFKKIRNYNQTLEKCHDTVGVAILNTSITIVFGFSILVLSNFIPTIYFGLFTGVAMLLAMISVLTLLPKLILVVKPFGND